MAKILVVDDRPAHRQFLVALLGYSGHQLLEAADGADALELARAERPDLIITDLLMPTMDGYEFVQQLRANPTIANTTVIFYTATYREREARAFARTCGVSYIISKPAEPEVILKTVASALGQEPSSTKVSMPEECERGPLGLITQKFIQKASELENTSLQLAALVELGMALAYENAKLYAEAKDRAAELEHEITERKQAEEALKQSQARLASIIDSAMDAIITVDANQNIVLFNSAAEKMFHCSAAEAIGQPLGKFIPERFRKAHSEHVSTFGDTNLTKRKIGALGTLVALRSDGEEFPVEISISQIETAGRKFYTSIIRDIVERKQTEEALRDSEERYRLLFEGNPLPMWVIDVETGSFLAVNEAAVHHYGYSEEEFLAMTLKAIRPTEEIPALLNGLPKAAATETDIVIERKHRKKDGTIIDVEITTRSIIFERKRARLAIVSDITERKLAEERIREQAALLNIAHDAITVRNLDDRIIFWNKGARRIYGWTAEEAIGEDVSKRLYKEGSSEYIEARKSFLENGEWTGELHQVAKDGHEVTVESRWTLVRNDEGKPKSILVVNTDITEKKKLEAQFLRAQRMESIGTLASGIAHDLNNVLAPILMSIQILRKRFPDEKNQQLFTTLEATTQRGADLVKQVLSFGRGLKGERTIVQIKHLILEIEKVIKETFPKSIEIRNDTPKDLWTISADATQLHQILMNLCVNARDSMPVGGRLTISAGNFLIDENYALMHIDAKVGPYVVISVSDTGSGIPPEVLDKIFDPFFTTKEFGKGTGLGLSTVIGIAKSHGGFVNVYTDVGKGTEFKVYLPAVETAETQRAKEERAELPTGQGEVILVVDDEASIREITKMSLEANGYKVLTAGDGIEAVTQYVQNREQIQVVLTDMMMPLMDGPATIRALQKISPQIKIIGVSGLAANEKSVEASLLGVKTFLPKPYTAEELLKTIHEVLSAK